MLKFILGTNNVFLFKQLLVFDWKIEESAPLLNTCCVPVFPFLCKQFVFTLLTYVGAVTLFVLATTVVPINTSNHTWLLILLSPFCVCMNIEKDLPVKPQKEWVHMNKLEPEKLEWMRDLPAPRKKGTKKVGRCFLEFQ